MTPEHFTLAEVTDGVWAAVADLTGIAIGNAAIIDAGGRTIVVDTFMSDVAAAELRRTAEALTGNAVFLAVNSHWHGDHTHGNQVFADIPIVSTRATLEEIATAAPSDVGAWQAEIDATIAHLEATAPTDPVAARRLESQRVFRGFAERFSLTLPDLLIERHLAIQGERSVEITTLGRGHTVSDVIVWLPDERVLVTGDLCWSRIHPRMHDGFPADWAGYIDQLIELDPVHVIPGHGMPTDVEALAALPEYFRAVDGLVGEVRAGTDATSLPAPEGSEEWADLARFHASLQALAVR